jgi:PKD repeat protein
LVPLTVNFANTTSGATNYNWNFGDGNSSTAVSPAHTYTNAGNYTVVLTAVGAGGTNSLTRANYIVVTNPPPPTVSFTGSPTNGSAPLTVNFANTTGATNYSWSFGDGNVSVAANPSHTYTNVGSYTVKLTAIGAGGTNSLTRANYIVVTNPPPVATFVASPTNGGAPLTVLFTNLSVNATNYNWDFGDGQTNASANPTNVYRSEGSYTVTLTAFGPGGQSIMVRSNYIVLSNSPPVLAAVGNYTVHPGMTVLFTNSASDADANQSLTFSLDPGAPASANVDSGTGVFRWTPDSTFASTTNPITVRVTDNGVPPLSATQSFSVAVVPLALQPVSLSNGVLTISWGSISGLTYRVQYATNLAAPSWNNLGVDVMATGDTASTTDLTEPDAQRFYRVLVVP